MYLENFERGYPLPGNVIADANPYQYLPSNLPDGIWYIVSSKDKKETELGFWKGRGDACEIFTNSLITGWRTTLEFFEGLAPHGQRTDWVMQEYEITRNRLCCNSKLEDSKSLCRVFCTGGPQEIHSENGSAAIDGGKHSGSMPSAISKAYCSTVQASTSTCQVKNRDDEEVLLAVAESLRDPSIFTLPELDCILRGDYLELDDLADPESHFSSSDNSLQSEEYFNSRALLQDLENEHNQDWQRKDSSTKFSVSTPVRPNEVVMRPATLGMSRCFTSSCGPNPLPLTYY
ncbi:unnamed protein product [Ilex paraguariensis]|uniref:NAC domain-containing protein n=1 Tax=Ilex paraguariensis TaxID=185542 RepID=A0ABC8UC45_9AQUA